MTTPQEKTKIVELRPNIYQIRAEKPSSHVYLLKGQAKNVLIDTGMAAHFPILKERLAKVGLRPEDIDLIILTHEHFDHIGATAFFLRRHWSPPIVLRRIKSRCRTSS